MNVINNMFVKQSWNKYLDVSVVINAMFSKCLHTFDLGLESIALFEVIFTTEATKWKEKQKSQEEHFHFLRNKPQNTHKS